MLTITLELSDDLESALRERAQTEGTTPERLAADGLRQLFTPDAEEQETEPRTAAELLALWQKEGLVGAWAGRTDIMDSTEYARRLRERVQNRNMDEGSSDGSERAA